MEAVRTTMTRASIGMTGEVTRLTSVTWMRNTRMSCGTIAHHSHHLGHLRKKGSLTSSKGRVALLENSIGIVCCRDISRGVSVTWRNSFKETLGNKISNFRNTVSLMEGLLMKDITGSRKVKGN
jgi:hypothetical protein